jgi:hypothetical protein
MTDNGKLKEIDGMILAYKLVIYACQEKINKLEEISEANIEDDDWDDFKPGGTD